MAFVYAWIVPLWDAQLLPQLLMELFDNLRIQCRHIEHMHEGVYEGCSNMNASGFITFLTYMLRQNSKRFYKGLYVTFKVAPDLKKNTVYLSSYSPLNEGHVCILTNSMLRTYTSDRDERIIFLRTGEIS